MRDRKEEAIWKSGVKFSTYHKSSMCIRAVFSLGGNYLNMLAKIFFVWLLLLYDKRDLVPDSRCACFILCL